MNRTVPKTEQKIFKVKEYLSFFAPHCLFTLDSIQSPSVFPFMIGTKN